MPSPPPAPDRDDDAGLLALAESVAASASAMLRESLGRRRQVTTKSTSTDLVTEMDGAAEAQIVDRLLAARPDDGVLGEEGASRAGTSGVRWVIDPVDGTTNYVYGFPAFAVSIAAERVGPSPGGPGRVVAGVVANVPLGEVFSARAGGGARRDGRPIHCTDAGELATALVATGFGYDAARRAHQAGVLAAVLPRVRDIRRAGAASLDLCAVACGRVDAYYEKGLAPWDFAAGALVATEAGALVSDLHGHPPTGSFVVAAPPELSGPLRRLLTDARAGDS